MIELLADHITNLYDMNGETKKEEEAYKKLNDGDYTFDLTKCIANMAGSIGICILLAIFYIYLMHKFTR